MDDVTKAIEEVVAEPEAKKMIEANDPDGRQPGDPDSTIELPVELLAPPVQNPTILMGDIGSLSADELAALLPNSVPAPREGVVADTVANQPVLSERTLAELNAGKRLVEEQAEVEAAQVAQGEREAPVKIAPEKVSAAFQASAPAFSAERYHGTPVVSRKTLEEQEAGRAVIKRKNADVDAARALMAKHAADRLKKGAPAEHGDLSYAAPRLPS